VTCDSWLGGWIDGWHSMKDRENARQHASKQIPGMKNVFDFERDSGDYHVETRGAAIRDSHSSY